MRHLPLSKWGVRAEARSRHSPLGRGGTCLPRRQTGVLAGRVGVTHFAVKAILLACVARAPQPPARLGRSTQVLSSVLACDGAGGRWGMPALCRSRRGARQLCRHEGEGWWKDALSGGLRDRCRQPALLQPSAAFGARREGLGGAGAGQARSSGSCRHSLGDGRAPRVRARELASLQLLGRLGDRPG